MAEGGALLRRYGGECLHRGFESLLLRSNVSDNDVATRTLNSVGALPRGTLSFLFTDIEGSTRLLHELGDERYAKLLDEHHRLLREALAEVGGREVSTEGDAFFVVFERPSDAVHGAALAQRAIANARWPEGVEVRVRMGIHTGEAVLAGDNYAGVAVHRAARIASAAHGGQVVVSHTTAGLLADEPAQDLTLRTLGEHKLKDLTEPQQLYQLVGDGLASEFPPVRTLDNRPTNLPIQATPFVGRERELAETTGLLRRDDIRVLTLTGPGGTGKTRLALQTAAELLDDFPAGVFLAELGTLTDPQLVLPTIAQTLGLHQRPRQTTAESLLEHTRGRPLLLLLDNFEQILDAGPLLARLLAEAPGVKLLVTSRAPLRVPGEQEYPVPPLPLPDPRRLPDVATLSQYEAVALFVERAKAVRPDFRVTDENAAAVAELCVRLDGLPLAIELAAARTKLLPPQALLARLDKRLELLTGGARGLPERQQTLRGAIDWSYDALDEAEQTLFARLAVFSGRWRIEAAEAVCNAGGELNVLDGLGSLVDTSLVRHEEAPDGEPRFTMLETIREYAAERLQAGGEAEELRRRHAEEFLGLAEQAEDVFYGGEQAALWARTEESNDNMRAALSWAAAVDPEVELRLAVALYGFWFVRANYAEGRTWLEDALSRAPSAPAQLRGRALASAAELAIFQGDDEDARSLVDRGLTLYRELGDPTGIARAVAASGLIALSESDFDRAEACFDDARRLLESGEKGRLERFLLAATLTNLGSIAMSREPADLERARALNQEALALQRELGNSDLAAVSLHNIGRVDLSFGRLHDAGTSMRQSLETAHELSARETIAYCLEGFAELALAGGDLQGAAQLIGASDALFDELGVTMFGSEAETRVETLERLQSALAEDRLTRERATGAALTVEQAVALALRASS